MSLKCPAPHPVADSLDIAALPGCPARVRGGGPYTLHFQPSWAGPLLFNPFGDEGFGVVPDGIADGAEAVENLLLGAGGLRRVGEAVVDALGVGRALTAGDVAIARPSPVRPRSTCPLSPIAPSRR